MALTGRVPIKSVDQGLATGRKQRSSPASLGDSASLTGSLGSPRPPGTLRARGNLSHALWVRHGSLHFPRASCRLLARQLLPVEKGVIKNRVSGVPWPDALLHLKAWLRARLALKFSFPGPYSVNGSPRSVALPRNNVETAGKRASRDSRQRARLAPLPQLLLLLHCLVATRPRQKQQVPWCKQLPPGVWTSSGSASHHRLSR